MPVPTMKTLDGTTIEVPSGYKGNVKEETRYLRRALRNLNHDDYNKRWLQIARIVARVHYLSFRVVRDNQGAYLVDYFNTTKIDLPSLEVAAMWTLASRAYGLPLRHYTTKAIINIIDGNLQ